jgi:hypothetical protein
MDVAFLLRAGRLLAEPQPAKLDYTLLIAALEAQRSTGAIVSFGPRTSKARNGWAEEEALVELLLAGPGWRQAASEQQGCFSRTEAGRRINAT